MADCTCWRCQAERMMGVRFVSNMRPGYVYMHEMYTEHFVEFDSLEDAEKFKAYADENIPYWDYTPVRIIDLNDPDVLRKYRERKWVDG